MNFPFLVYIFFIFSLTLLLIFLNNLSRAQITGVCSVFVQFKTVVLNKSTLYNNEHTEFRAHVEPWFSRPAPSAPVPLAPVPPAPSWVESIDLSGQKK